MLWHPIMAPCEFCEDTYCATDVVSFRADGWVAVGGPCPKCHRPSCITFRPEDVLRKCRAMENPNTPDFSLLDFVPKGRPS